MSKIHSIQQKHYPNNNMESVFKELCMLEDIVEKSGHSQSDIETLFTLRSAIIRLVTIIEQFFHAVLAEKINARTAEYDHHTIKIHKALLVDTIRTVEYSWHSTYPKGVEEHIQQFLVSEEPNEADLDRCKLNKERLASLLEPYCHAKTSDLWHMFIANEHSLQSTRRITDEMGKHQITVFDDSDVELSVKSYNRLFDARHILVHTMNDAAIDVKRYVKSTMRLFKRVLKAAGYNDSHVAFIYGYALNEAGRHGEAITVLNDLAGHGPYGIVFQTLGEAYYAKGDAVSGKKCLMAAMSVAHDVHRMFGTRSRPRGASYASKEDLSNVWINNALLYRAIGETFRINGEMDLTVQCFEDALTQCPSYILLQEDIGGKFVGMGMSEKAIRCFKKVVAAAPTNTYALDQLGMLYGVLDPKKSAKYYKRLLKLKPENESAKRALESLHCT